jgi:hypothetical protein
MWYPAFMSGIHVYETARCTFSSVPEYIQAYVESHAAKSGEVLLELRAPLGDVMLERDVIATLKPLPHFSGYVRMQIRWVPKATGPYPAFDGILNVSDEGAGLCRIDLDGAYQPPFGPAGILFDAAVGKRIAENTVHELLKEVKAFFESAERAKYPEEAVAVH